MESCGKCYMFKTNVATGFCVAAVICFEWFLSVGNSIVLKYNAVHLLVDSISQRTFFPLKVLVPSLMTFSLQEA